MAYDATGPWVQIAWDNILLAVECLITGQEVRIASSKSNNWTSILWLRFYASANQGISYANIVAQYPGAENFIRLAHLLQRNSNHQSQNNFAIQNAGGVMTGTSQRRNRFKNH